MQFSLAFVQSLSHVELFDSLTDEERQSLAARLRVAPFVRGEVLTRQGAAAHWLYVITKGEAEVRVSTGGNLSEHLAKLGLKYSDGPVLKENGSGFAFIDAPEGYEIELMQRSREDTSY